MAHCCCTALFETDKLYCEGMEELACHKLDDATAYLYHWAMNNKIPRILINIVLISLILLPLGAATNFTANYDQEPYLEFKKGEYPYQNTQLVGLLGTITVTANPPISLKEPSLANSNSSINFWFKGMMDWDPDNPYTTWAEDVSEFYLDTVTYVNGSFFYMKRQSQTDGLAILTNSQYINNVSSFVVKLYFRGQQPAAYYQPGKPYTLQPGRTIGTYRLAVAPPDKGINDAKIYVDTGLNGALPQTGPIPIIGSGGSVTTLPETMPYVDAAHPPVRPSFAISLDKTPSITLSQAYTGGNQPPTVAEASVAITNGKPNKTYKVFIKFDSSSVLNSQFRLRLTNFPTVYAIPYTFLFGTDTVTPGIDIPWDGLVINPTGQQNKKTIKVTGIDQTTAEKAVSGGYSDTITVTITASDTV